MFVIINQTIVNVSIIKNTLAENFPPASFTFSSFSFNIHCNLSMTSKASIKSSSSPSYKPSSLIFMPFTYKVFAPFIIPFVITKNLFTIYICSVTHIVLPSLYFKTIYMFSHCIFLHLLCYLFPVSLIFFLNFDYIIYLITVYVNIILQIYITY